jgi:hypothetical protein
LRNPERKYSPAEVASTEVVPVCGNPDPARICTSIIERSNLSLRMSARRWTRLTNAFGRNWENQWAAAMLWYTYYISLNALETNRDLYRRKVEPRAPNVGS